MTPVAEPPRPADGEGPGATAAAGLAVAPGLEDLAAAMTSASSDELAARLDGLSAQEWDDLSRLIGSNATAVVRRDRGTRAVGAKRGHVMLLPGIMGTDLAVLDDRDVPSVMWFNIRALASGGMAKLVLPIDGSAPLHRIHAGGLLKLFYLPMQVRLGVNWNAQLVPYDWRLDIDDLADDLAAAIRPFEGEPVHIVAHSMGGLVARAMIRQHPDLWASMRVTVDGNQSGGRLVMLGTPNRGSFAPVLAFTGRDSKVRALAFLDPRLSKRDIVEVLATFPGLYQMLPSTKAGLRGVEELYVGETWPEPVVHQQLLDRARGFHEAMDGVGDPERMVYIAGFGHRTVDGIERRRGRLRWHVTRAGDGTVPHALGTLDAATTFWSSAKHGSLPKDRQVLSAIDELLETGTTTLLPSGAQAPSRRALEEDDAWVDDEDLDAAADLPPVNRELGIDDAASILADVLPVADVGADSVPRVHVRIEVLWEDIGKAAGDVVAVGHYQGVYPTASEAALDEAISAGGAADRILGAMTARGVLTGLVGDVMLVPLEREGSPRAAAAIVGLGRPGTFGLPEHEVIVRNLLWTAEHAVKARTLATVLIGCGSGNLGLTEAVESLLRAIDVAAAEREIGEHLATIRLVEFELGRARRVLTTLERLLADRDDETPAAIELESELVEGTDGTISDETALLELLAMATAEKEWSEQQLDALDRSPVIRRRVASRLGPLRSRGVGDYQVMHRRVETSNPTPTRLSVLVREGQLWASAISDSATVPERHMGLELELFESLVKQANVEAAGSLDRAGEFLLRFALPAEFRPLLPRGRSTVLEVDRHTAALPWEILMAEGAGPAKRYLGLSTALARQLRTTQSRPVGVTGRVTLKRVLVIGDPGVPGGGGRLPGARAEAESVVTLLGSHDIPVDYLLGPEGADTTGANGPATLANVLHHLLQREYDVVHYAGTRHVLLRRSRCRQRMDARRRAAQGGAPDDGRAAAPAARRQRLPFQPRLHGTPWAGG